MRIYSDILTVFDLNNTIQKIPGMYIDNIQPINTKLRARGWVLRTASHTGNRFRNTGKTGADRIYAATFHDHGVWFNLLYLIDPNAKISCYSNANEFHRDTKNQFKTHNTINLTLNLTDAELDALEFECLIKSQEGISINGIPITHLFKQLHTQVKALQTARDEKEGAAVAYRA